MADQKLTDRPATTTLDGADLVHVVTDVAGTPTTKKITWLNAIKEMFASRFAADAGSNDTYVATLSPAPAAYVMGEHYRFKANTANTGACTINFNSLGAKTIKKAAGGITTDLADNDIRAGQWVDLVYDGTNMQMQSQTGNSASGIGGSTGSVDNAILRADGTGGATMQSSGVSVNDSSQILFPSGDAYLSANNGSQTFRFGPGGDGGGYAAAYGSNFTVGTSGSRSGAIYGGTYYGNYTDVTSGATYTCLYDDFAVGINKGTGSATTVHLPSSGGGDGLRSGRMITITDVKGDAATNNITVDAPGARKIAGQTNYIINTNFSSVTVMFTGVSGNEWVII